MPKRSEANRKTNVWVARSIPLFMLAVIGYASWVVTKLLCVDYLIHPAPSLFVRRRPGSAIAILITYYILLIVLVISYGRLLYMVARRPGLIPRGPQWYVEESRKRNSKHRHRRGGSGSKTEGEKPSQSDLAGSRKPKDTRYLAANETLPFKVEDFWLRDVFVCNPDGRPPFCSTCYNWKPDRSHHCSELNRCVLKFDHFCPWVGGVVSETSFKFFIQFTFYAALYTLELLIVMAYFFAQRNQNSNFINGHWIAVIALAGLFFLFSGGMCMSSCQFAFINSTTIENLNRKTKVWNLAVYVNPAVVEEAHQKGILLRLISYPRPAEEQLHMLAEHGAEQPVESAAQPTQGSDPSAAQRVFAILETEPGANPFNVGSFGNFQDIMGYTIWEWLFPIRPSPCLKHDDLQSLYKLGPVVDELKVGTGLKSWDKHSSRRASRRRRTGREQSTTHDDFRA